MKKVIALSVVVLVATQLWAQPRFVKERTDYTGEEVMLPFVFRAKNNIEVNLPGTLRLSGRLDTGETELLDLSRQNLVAYPYRELRGSILSNGYLPHYFALFPMDLKAPEHIGVMKNIEENSSFIAEGITFLGDNTNVYFTSVDGLQTLLDFMNMHSNVRIRIIGHVNVTPETKLNDSQLVNLAKKRAEGIMEYLILHGISKHRVSVMGRGREGVKYPNPQTEAELEYNRRVEVVIMGL